jgi:hypothetical protein
MNYEVETDLPVDIGAVLPYIQDLTKYPLWMGLVHAVAPLDDDGGHEVELRGKIGPFARSKRLRMVAVAQASPHRVRFERSEHDGRDHARWILQATMSAVGTDPSPVTRVSITLLYEGRLWSPVVERVLADEIERSKARLLELVMTRPQ